MADRTNQAPQTAAQLDFVFADIAGSAKAIKRFVLRLVVEAAEPEDERDVQAMHKAIEVLADRIGLLADWSGTPLGPLCPVVGDRPQDWMMPPTWHWEEEGKSANSEEGGS